jgi:hypothetical protein
MVLLSPLSQSKPHDQNINKKMRSLIALTCVLLAFTAEAKPQATVTNKGRFMFAFIFDFLIFIQTFLISND